MHMSRFWIIFEHANCKRMCIYICAYLFTLYVHTSNVCIYLSKYILCTYIKCIYLYIYVQFICPSFVIVTCLILFQINKSLDFPLCHPTSKARTGTAMDLIESNEAWAAAKVLKVDKVEIQVEVVQVVK